ncbi:peptidoglycan editing factor PgeF [Borreliella yangtzensis]|uniref:peptidoglycan editing factor PgeF n=1 Tax=Borreliella yangtzensis TaxID=683292 RepID=UPI002647719F|nr:peptidoglycan editing factor PgeF [Borreliella yangtzensis]WKC75271.1 peptidoglycan editing factor PgeF [Borreliella yangtzensis]
MKTIDHELYYEFKVADDVRMIYTKKPFSINLRELSNDNLNFVPKSKKIKYLKQLHTDIIYKVEDDFINFQEGDGLISSSLDVALVAYFADCLPIYFYDSVKKFIGIIHSGYKGSFNLIILKMLFMFEKMGSTFEDLKIVFGPYNRSCCYEVSEIFLKEVSNKFSKNLLLTSFVKRDGKIYFDNASFNLGLLSSFNLNIYNSKLCTYCLKDLYSYRGVREGQSYALIWRI